jgi:outer membrane murein-binding lipoprotein Lpp
MRWPLIRRSKVTAMLHHWEISVAKHKEVRADYLEQIRALNADVARIESTVESLRAQVESFYRERAVIKGMLDAVPVYEGMAEGPLVPMLSGLIQDHAELESRIDTVIMEIRAALVGVPEDTIYHESLTKIAGYLQGAPRFPDLEP